MKKSLILGICLVLLSGCGLFKEPEQMNKSAQQLAADGAAAFMDGDFRDAVKAYTDLKDWYPFSQYAILAELKIADAHFYLEEYDQAIVAYEGFEKMHPRNEAVPYVINQTGMCWFKQIDTVDRDARPAKNAKALFQRLIDQFPGHELATAAQEHIDACTNNIAGHELYVANFYNKTKQYKAALKRYEYIARVYPGTKPGETAASKISKLAEKVKKIEAQNASKPESKD